MRVLVATDDLLARGRIEGAARAAGAELGVVPLARWRGELSRFEPDIVVLDLDAGGQELLRDVEATGAEGLLPERVIGYFSHIDDDLRVSAEGAGIRALPRGRFWREAAAIFGSDPQQI